MKFLQDRILLPNPPHLVQPPSLNPTNSTPFHICIRIRSPPPKTSPPSSSTRRQKCLAMKISKVFFDFPALNTASLSRLSAVQLPLMAAVSFPLPCFSASAEEISTKINIESVLVSIDDFFNRYPYFVASLAFIWLVVAPLTEAYLNKYKFISCIDAFRKLRDDPSTQLLDIRKKESVRYLNTPNLKVLNKSAVGLEFVEDCEEEFVEKALKSFQDPGNTIICVLDNFDGNSLIVAKLLFKNGFKEVYAIKGGMLGKDGWQAIQGTLFPPSLHVYPTKKRRKSLDQANGRPKGNNEHDENTQLLNSFGENQIVVEGIENGYMESKESSSATKNFQERPLSPYPKFIDLKPPSSPTPSNSRT